MKLFQTRIQDSRRALLRGSIAALFTAAVGTLAVLPLAVEAQAPKSGPVTLNIVDVAGNLALTQVAIDLFAKAHPELIAKINIVKATAPELPGKLRAMQAAGRSDIDLVLTGTDFLAAGVEQGVLMKLMPDKAAKFPNLMKNYIPAAVGISPPTPIGSIPP